MKKMWQYGNEAMRQWLRYCIEKLWWERFFEKKHLKKEKPDYSGFSDRIWVCIT
jgi:hypothetical protein